MAHDTTSPISFYLERGATACFLIHGFTGDTLDLRELGDYLAQQNFTVKADLLPGHGTQYTDLRTTPRNLWKDTVEKGYQALRSEFDQVYVIGLSMGGSLALYLAEQYTPDGVITLSTPVQLRRWQITFLPLLGLFTDTIRKGMGITNGNYSGYDRYPVKSTKELIRLLGEVRGQLGKVTVPLRIFHSVADKVVPVHSAYAIAKAVNSEDVQLRIYRRSGHLMTTGVEKDRIFRDILHEIGDLQAIEKQTIDA